MRTLLRQTRFVAFLVAAVCTFVRNVPVGYVTTHALVTSMLAAYRIHNCSPGPRPDCPPRWLFSFAGVPRSAGWRVGNRLWRGPMRRAEPQRRCWVVGGVQVRVGVG